MTPWYQSLFTTARPNTIWAYSDDDWDTLLSHRYHSCKRKAIDEATEPAEEATTTPQYMEQAALDSLIRVAGLSLRICKYGEKCYGRFTRCPHLHTLPDILALFRRSDVVALYRDGTLLQDTNEARPQQWETRSTSDFVCHNTTQCTQSPAIYSLRLKHDTCDYLKYPACRAFCSHCRKTRTLPVYV